MVTGSQTHEQVMEKVRQLLPKIAERIPLSEQLRRQPSETIQEILDAGLVRTLMPKRWGGYELPLDTMVESVMEVAKIDASAGWSYSFLLIHGWFLALFPDQAQQDVWGETPDVPLATSLSPEGRLRRVEGGYQLSGRWAWSSGVEYCNWNMLSALLLPESPEQHPEVLVCLLPSSDYQILDTWYVAGLQASGSQDVRVEDVFIPSHRTVRLGDLIRGEGPGAQENTGPLYNLPLIGAFPTSITAVTLGSTMGAFENWRERSQKHLQSGVYGVHVDSNTHVFIRLGELAARLDGLQLLLKRALDTVRLGGPVEELVRIRNRRDYAYIALECRRTVNALYEYSGAWANFSGHPVQRHWRDVNAIAAHVAQRFESASEGFGRAALSLPRNMSDPFS